MRDIYGGVTVVIVDSQTNDHLCGLSLYCCVIPLWDMSQQRVMYHCGTNPEIQTERLVSAEQALS